MPAQDETPAVAGNSGWGPAVLMQVQLMIELGECHPWLFPCPECKCPVLAQMRYNVALCASCGTEIESAGAVLGQRFPDQLLADISEIMDEWAETGQ